MKKIVLGISLLAVSLVSAQKKEINNALKAVESNDIATTNNTISIITAGPIAKDISDEFEIDRKRTAGLLDIFSSGFQGLIPYGGQLLVAGAFAKISPVSIVPYAWYPMLILLMGIISIITGFPKIKTVNN